MDKKSILIINSSEAIMEFSKKMLERAGYAAHCVEGVSGARAYLSSTGEPDCIIIDRELSDGNAFEFCCELKTRSSTPVLLVSFDRDDELKALRSGSDDFLKRPVDYDILKARINILLSTKNASVSHERRLGDRDRRASGLPARIDPEWAPGGRAQALEDGFYDRGIKLSQAIQDINDAEHARVKRNRVVRRILYTVVAICFLLTIVGLAFLYNREKYGAAIEITDWQIPMGAFLMFDGNARPYPGGAVGTVEGPDYLLPCYARIAVKAGDTDVRMVLLNPAGNTEHFTFEVIKKDTGESLYLSGLVEPGMCIPGFNMDSALPRGEHEATVVIRVYDTEGLGAAAGPALAAVDFIIEAK